MSQEPRKLDYGVRRRRRDDGPPDVWPRWQVWLLLTLIGVVLLWVVVELIRFIVFWVRVFMYA